MAEKQDPIGEIRKWHRTFMLYGELAVMTPVMGVYSIAFGTLDKLGLNDDPHYYGNYPTYGYCESNFWAANTTQEFMGKHPEKLSPYIVMANHRSHLDGPAMLLQLKPVTFRFLVKQELLYVPFLGQAFWALNFIFVKRGDKESARDSATAVINRIKGGENIVVFPEGTRARDGRMLPFKKGGFLMAIEGGVPILPIGIAGSAQVYGYGFKVRAHRGHIIVNCGEPIETTGYTADRVDELIEKVRNRIKELEMEAHLRWQQRARELELPVTEEMINQLPGDSLDG